MAIYKTGVKGFDDAVMAAEVARQTALVGAPQGVADGVNATYLNTVVNAGLFYNVLTINEQIGLQSIKTAVPGVPIPTPPPVVTTFTLDLSLLDGSATLA